MPGKNAPPKQKLENLKSKIELTLFPKSKKKLKGQKKRNVKMQNVSETKCLSNFRRESAGSTMTVSRYAVEIPPD